MRISSGLWLVSAIVCLLNLGFSNDAKMSPVEFPQEKIDEVSRSVHSLILNGELKIPEKIGFQKEECASDVSSILHFRDFRSPNIFTPFLDTLVIGDTPGETLTVTGPWFHEGPIFVIGDGVLQFRNAQVTNVGNLYSLGSGRIYGDSSRLFFPQEYWYQRGFIAAEGGYLSLHACTTSFSGYPYNFFIGDSALVEVQDVFHEDFTTALVSGKSSILLDGVNLSGEYVMLDSAKADFRNATTLLIWHQFPSNSLINFSYPNGDTVYSFLFNDSLPGVDSVGYRVTVDTCYDVLWGLMPTTGSDVQISNSSIRTIGVWFEGTDTINVSGLVNNSSYSDFTAPISDRNLRLINTSVRTWSLYPFDSVRLNVTSCILGEVLTFNQSYVTLSNYFLDGSGGYLGAADSSFAISFLCAVSANIRSERSGIFLLGYAGVPYGDLLAIGNSLLVVVQSSLPQEPVPLEGSVAWFGNISGPSQATVGDTVSIIGSAWIDRGPQHTVYDFGQYQMFFQGSGDSLWTMISPPSLIEKRVDTLDQWDTYGLNPGIYTLRLVLKNNYGDSVDAFKNVNLLAVGVEEEFMEIPADRRVRFTVHSRLDGVSIHFVLPNSEEISVTAYDILGREAEKIFTGKADAGDYSFSWKPSVSGVYFLRLHRNDGSSPNLKKVVWIR